MSAHAYLNQKNEIVGFEYLNENAVPQNPCTACGGGTKPVTCESCGGSGACHVCGGRGSV